MSRNISIPFCPGVRPADVWRVASEFKAIKLARRYNVRKDLMQSWLTGQEAMPLWLYELLAFRVRLVIPSTGGLFAGMTVEDGQRLTGPMFDSPIRFDDLCEMKHYRRASSLAERQADLIESLMRERDWYKRQCSLEARHGLMLRQLFED